LAKNCKHSRAIIIFFGKNCKPFHTIFLVKILNLLVQFFLDENYKPSSAFIFVKIVGPPYYAYD